MPFIKPFRNLTLSLVLLMVAGLLIPQKIAMPVEGATKSSYNKNSFWYYPWGRSVTHKGIDIFAKKGRNVRSSTSGIVIYCGQNTMGGNFVLVLGPKWRLHYYAHLQAIKTRAFTWVNRNEVIGSVGNSGNAAGKPPHLHYSIVTLVPYVFRIDAAPQGWMKMFYLNPIDYLE